MPRTRRSRDRHPESESRRATAAVLLARLRRPSSIASLSHERTAYAGQLSFLALDLVEIVDARVDGLDHRELGIDGVEVPGHGTRQAVADAFARGDCPDAVLGFLEKPPRTYPWHAWRRPQDRTRSVEHAGDAWPAKSWFRTHHRSRGHAWLLSPRRCRASVAWMRCGDRNNSAMAETDRDKAPRLGRFAWKPACLQL